MGVFDERVRNHGIWSVLSSLGPTIDVAVSNTAISPEAIEMLERARSVLTICGVRLSATDPQLLVVSHLDSLLSTFQNVIASVNSFIVNSDNDAVLAASMAYLDAALLIIPAIPFATTPEDLTGLSEAASGYYATLQNHLKYAVDVQDGVEEKNKNNQTQLEVLEGRISVEQQKISTLISDHQSQFSSAQDKRLSDFTTTQADFLAKFASLTNDQQTQFSADQNSRRTSYAEFEAANSKRVSDLFNDLTTTLALQHAKFLKEQDDDALAHKSQLDILQQGYKDNAAEILDKIDQHKKDVESLVGVIGNLGITSGYKKVADHARLFLYVWQTITLLSLACLIFIASVVAFPKFAEFLTPASQKAPLTASVGKTSLPGTVSEIHSVESSDTNFYHGLLSRIFLSITFGVFAAYAGQQASRFFQIEQKNRKLALELEALGPFIEPLSREDRDKFRVLVGDRSFGVKESDGAKEQDPDAVTLAKVLQSKGFQDAILGALKDVVKSSGKADKA